MNADAPVLNIAVALTRMSGDRELLKMLLMTFLEDAPHKITKITDYIAAGNYQAACLEAHTLKGAACTVGAERLGDIASYIECELRNLSTSNVQLCTHPIMKSEINASSAPQDPLEAIQFYLQFSSSEFQRIEVRALCV